MGMLPEPLGLLKYQELGETDLINLFRQLPSSSSHRRRNALNQFCGPIQIRLTVVLFFQCAEQCIVLKPVRLLVTKPLVRGTQVSPLPRLEAAPDLPEKLMLEPNDRAIIDKTG